MAGLSGGRNPAGSVKMSKPPASEPLSESAPGSGGGIVGGFGGGGRRLVGLVGWLRLCGGRFWGYTGFSRARYCAWLKVRASSDSLQVAEQPVTL